MNRRELLKLFGSTGVVGAIGGAAALERLFEPFRAIELTDSGYLVVKGKSPYALTVQWGISDAEGLVNHPIAFNQIFGTSQTSRQPGRHWVAWGLT